MRDSAANRYIPRPNRGPMTISPPVLFFVLGAIAALVKSDLRVPRQVTKLLSLYLLWAIGFTGGVKIAKSGFDHDALMAIAIGITLAATMPLAVFALLRKKLGVPVFFLLDLGLLAARRLRNFIARGWSLVGYGLVIPPIAATVALALARVAGLGMGDATLLAVLASSASYIAVPAAARIAIPKAEPSVYIGMALAVTFPFNVVFGIPLYLSVAKSIWGE